MGRGRGKLIINTNRLVARVVLFNPLIFAKRKRGGGREKSSLLLNGFFGTLGEKIVLLHPARSVTSMPSPGGEKKEERASSIYFLGRIQKASFRKEEGGGTSFRTGAKEEKEGRYPYSVSRSANGGRGEEGRPDLLFLGKEKKKTTGGKRKKGGFALTGGRGGLWFAMEGGGGGGKKGGKKALPHSCSLKGRVLLRREEKKKKRKGLSIT